MSSEAPKQAGYQLEKITTAVSVASDTLKGKADDFEQAEQLQAQWIDGSGAEKKLTEQILGMSFSAIRNIAANSTSNAKTGGLEDDFQLTDAQYSIIVMVFFISYLICEVPSNMILIRVRPSWFLPGLGLVWGTFAALMGATQNWGQLAAMRFLLGVAEAGFAPGYVCGSDLLLP
ncbi:hypothetical protein E8E13_008288 [Curvularia kusanoi]|uniref:Major facilitator superfamily (MFS) profile domain-containing protein n=1 Tax=Curvularia kusanoi TaxID=90978 RepID=A0A9P4TCJ1_CURKU|nr:hypothetical protein E8E13_008288 [Curvularia kusanoi]